MLTEVERMWKRSRRRLRHLRRDWRLRRDEAHPAVGFIAVALLILLTVGAVVYALSL
ncbi:hypothetical protein ACN27E_13670 [Mycobacterium sp. WMMD1722]|uniref:hypothetical protein n=1 Tax=Mycobacterium sp. WMMD1722 TaxID=3404117 RepID=UPI003BF4CF12